MSKGDGGRAERGRDKGRARASSRSTVRMTAERARAIQAHADRTQTNQDFKARAMSAADRGEDETD
jgi:hypothetical protein